MRPSSDHYKLAHDASTAASTAEAKAWSALQCERPTTVEDLAAYAIHLTQVVREFDHETEATSETAEAFEALSSACMSLAGQERLR